MAPAALQSDPAVNIPGLASSYLASESCNTVYAQIIPCSFKLPFLPKTLIIMVAVGSGIAPFRGFLHERARQAATGRNIGRMVLFSGCRHPEVDQLHGDEIGELTEGSLKGKLEVFTALSRLSEEKIYVQHLVKQESNLVMRLLLNDDGAIYICGSVTMAKSVQDVVVERVAEARGWTAGEAETWRKEMKRAKLWHEDIWG